MPWARAKLFKSQSYYGNTVRARRFIMLYRGCRNWPKRAYIGVCPEMMFRAPPDRLHCE
jgi:hypothetical protein